jgi:tol-pal system protein YbgF
MKKRLNLITAGIGSGLVLAWLTGCAAESAQKSSDHMRDLEKQVMQLKAENANLQARTRELDDKVLLYEKMATMETHKKSKDGMRTVHLTPDGAAADGRYADAEVYDEEASVSFREQFAEGEGDAEDRPVLHLNEGSLARYDNSTLSTANNRRSSSQSWKDIPVTNQGDNLGVVSADGQLEQAEADSMNLFNAAYRSYNNRDYAGALAGFSTFLQRESNHRFADNAVFWIAECYLAMGKQFKAVGEFERLLRRYPKSEQAASSLYRIGFIYDQMQDMAKAREYYFKVVEKFPGTEAARKASRRMSDDNGGARLVRTSAKR